MTTEALLVQASPPCLNQVLCVATPELTKASEDGGCGSGTGDIDIQGGTDDVGIHGGMDVAAYRSEDSGSGGVRIGIHGGAGNIRIHGMRVDALVSARRGGLQVRSRVLRSHMEVAWLAGEVCFGIL